VPPEPQPALKPINATSIIAPSNVVHRRRFTGIPKNSSAASAAPPPIGNSRILGRSTAPDVAAVVLTVNVAVAVPAMVLATSEPTEQVGASGAPLVTAQLNEIPEVVRLV
jgi:hypothetical protein